MSLEKLYLNFLVLKKFIIRIQFLILKDIKIVCILVLIRWIILYGIMMENYILADGKLMNQRVKGKSLGREYSLPKEGIYIMDNSIQEKEMVKGSWKLITGCLNLKIWARIIIFMSANFSIIKNMEEVK